MTDEETLRRLKRLSKDYDDMVMYMEDKLAAKIEELRDVKNELAEYKAVVKVLAPNGPDDETLNKAQKIYDEQQKNSH